MKREFATLFTGWLVLAVLLIAVGRQNLSAPGLYYDEASHGGLAKDFVAGQGGGSHMPGVSTVSVFGKPFPTFVQPGQGAVKSWLLIPVFKIFGSTVAVLRGANLFLCVAALLLCMVWTWRLLGLADALLGGVLLASDPAFFFLGVLDWSSALPGLLCRLGGLFLALLAWRRQQVRWALAAGFVLGLGLFCRLDSGVVVLGVALAGIIAGGRSVEVSFRLRAPMFLMALLGLLAGGATIVAPLCRILSTPDGPHWSLNQGEFAEKFYSLRSLYDGTCFYRLMDAGGVFDKIYVAASPVWTPFGILVLVAAVVLVADVVSARIENPLRATKIFLVLSTMFITLGLLFVPGVGRIDQASLVYPFPHLLIAAALVSVWRRRRELVSSRPMALTMGMAAAVAVLVACNVFAVQRTERLIHATGGCGWWSGAAERFAAEVNHRSDLTVASLDWGFNEQMEFLTRGPRLGESFLLPVFTANPERLPHDPRCIYLVHPPEFSRSPLGGQFMASVERDSTNAVIRPWRDDLGRVAFYTIGFTAP